MIHVSASGPSAVMTVEEAAAELRIGRTTAYDLVRRGEIPSVRLGRQLRVPRHALERMLQMNEEDRHAANVTVFDKSALRSPGNVSTGD